MNQTQKKPSGNLANFESVLISQNERNSNTPKPPTKAETCLDTFMRCGSLNTFEANFEYGDTCLHTTISDLFINHRLSFKRSWETIVNRVGRPVKVKRFKPEDIEHMRVVLERLRKARGVI